MSRHVYFLTAVMVVFVFSTPSSGQRDRVILPPPPKRVLPPEVIVSPGQLTPELDNTELRASRVRIPAKSVLSNFTSRNGLLVAVTDIEILVRTLKGSDRNIRLTAGQTHWIDVATTAAVNLGSGLCEFVYVESER
jgi:hypothetical protein